MRIRRLLALPVTLVVPVALVVISATGVIGPGTWGNPAGAAPVAGGPAPGRGGERCMPASSHQGTPPHFGGQPGRPSAPAVRGDISVSIPPTVFIRVFGQYMMVTTNTGMPPESQDGFWVLDGNRATPASTSMRAQVLAGCTSSMPR